MDRLLALIPQRGLDANTAHRRRNRIRRALNSRVDLVGRLWSVGDPVELTANRAEALANIEVNQSLEWFAVDFHFLENLDPDEQGRFFRALENIPTLRYLRVSGEPGSREKTCLPALLTSLPQIVNGLSSLTITNINVCGNSSYRELVDVLGANDLSLHCLVLMNIAAEVNENVEGSLDPILRAMHHGHHQPASVRLTGGFGSWSHQSVNETSLVTTEALCLYLTSTAAFPSESPRNLRLSYLGLDDDHCEIIATKLQSNGRDNQFCELNLIGNPTIGQKGYEAILGLLNREHWIGKVHIDEQSWQSKFDLVVDMNTKHGRGEFLQNGAFDSEADWFSFLARLAGLVENAEADDARNLNFLWYTISEKPEFLPR
jgi:hypothetical protein